MTRPLIGLTLDSSEEKTYSSFSWYALRENYCTAIEKAGGLPVALPHTPALIEEYLNHIKGLVITGGGFDVDPILFGASSRHPTVTIKEKRTNFEFAINCQALERNIPVLGICGGQQLLNVVLGGTLFQHIPDEIENSLPHKQPNPRNEPSHDINIKQDTLLYKIGGLMQTTVNSAHHQAVKDVGPGVVINAVAPDGVIEGIESPNYAFCLGIQWHPEFSINPLDDKIFRSFIKASQGFYHSKASFS